MGGKAHLEERPLISSPAEHPMCSLLTVREDGLAEQYTVHANNLPNRPNHEKKVAMNYEREHSDGTYRYLMMLF